MAFSETAERQENCNNFCRESHFQGAEVEFLYYLVHGKISVFYLSVEMVY